MTASAKSVMQSLEGEVVCFSQDNFSRALGVSRQSIAALKIHFKGNSIDGVLAVNQN